MENKLQDAIERLAKADKTSASIWVNYWAARKFLRELALARYEEVTNSYLEKDSDLSLPSREFKIIADDVHGALAMFDEEETINL